MNGTDKTERIRKTEQKFGELFGGKPVQDEGTDSNGSFLVKFATPAPWITGSGNWLLLRC